MVKKEIKEEFGWSLIYISSIASVILLGVYFRVIYGPIFFPLPIVVAFFGGVVLVLCGGVMSFKWHELKDRIYSGELVTEGLYKYVRHPHYSSIILSVFGISLLLQSLLIFLFALLNTIILNEAAKREEKYLIKTFGNAYVEYMARVRWRFIPLLL